MGFFDKIRRRLRPVDYIAEHAHGSPTLGEDVALDNALTAYVETMRRNYHFVTDAQGDVVAWPKASPSARPGGTWAIWRYAQQDPDVIGYRAPRGPQSVTEDVTHA